MKEWTRGVTLKEQLDTWQETYNSMDESKASTMIPLSGNHEIDFYDPSVKGEAPASYTYREWIDWFLENNYDLYSGNGPKPEGDNPDCLVCDESNLSYSFKYWPNTFCSY